MLRRFSPLLFLSFQPHSPSASVRGLFSTKRLFTLTTNILLKQNRDTKGILTWERRCCLKVQWLAPLISHANIIQIMSRAVKLSERLFTELCFKHCVPSDLTLFSPFTCSLPPEPREQPRTLGQGLGGCLKFQHITLNPTKNNVHWEPDRGKKKKVTSNRFWMFYKDPGLEDKWDWHWHWERKRESRKGNERQREYGIMQRIEMFLMMRRVLCVYLSIL